MNGWDEIREGGQKAQTALPVGPGDVMYSEQHCTATKRMELKSSHDKKKTS